MQKILVAGGAGFIGSHLCERLLHDGHEVLCVDNFLTGTRGNIEDMMTKPGFRLLEFDVTKQMPRDINADVVFHLASPASPNHHSRISYHNLPMETMMVNTQGTQLLLEFAKQNNAKFLFASTSEVYGDPAEHPQREEYNGNVSTTGPRAIYDEAKRFGETLVSYFERKEGVDTRIGRIFNTFGPRMVKDDMRMIIRFIYQALNSEPITIFGDGNQTRSLCYASDMVDGLIRLMFEGNTRGKVVNLGSDEEHTVREFAEMVKALTHSESEIITAEEMPDDDPKKRRPDISKARSLLSWEPKTTLHDGLVKTIEFVRRTQ